MTVAEFRGSLGEGAPAAGLSAPLRALWWDARDEWARAHGEVDDLETPQAMAVHAYLHRREGDLGNAGYWYRRAGMPVCRGALAEEWVALVERLLAGSHGSQVTGGSVV